MTPSARLIACEDVGGVAVYAWGIRMRAYCAVLFGLLLGSAAHAATLEQVSGNLSINRGSGYLPVKGSISLKPGDTLMASPGASGQVVFMVAAGCPSSLASCTWWQLSPLARGKLNGRHHLS